jgi:hypothetical protein
VFWNFIFPPVASTRYVERLKSAGDKRIVHHRFLVDHTGWARRQNGSGDGFPGMDRTNAPYLNPTTGISFSGNPAARPISNRTVCLEDRPRQRPGAEHAPPTGKSEQVQLPSASLHG